MLDEFSNHISALTLVPSSGGRFEVTVDGELVHSKAKTGRHAEPDDIRKVIQARLKAM